MTANNSINRHETITEFVDGFAGSKPDAVFLVDAAQTCEITYSKLQKDMRALGGFFQAHGLKPTDKVGFLLDNSYASALIFAGAMYHGLVVVPINVVSGEAQVAHVLGHAEPALVLASSEYAENFKAALSNVSALQIINGVDDLYQIIDPHQTNDAPIFDATADTPALLIYTSGTTGEPKGVLLSQKNVIAGGHNVVMAHEIVPADRALCVLPLYHINGEVVTIIAPLISGSSVVMLGKFSTSRFWQALAEHRCTWFSVVPTIIGYLLNTATDTSTLDLSALRFGRSASAPLPPEIHKKFEADFGIPIIETMGLSETAAQILSNPLGRRKIGSAGVAFGNQVEIIGDGEQFLPPNTEGELVVKGDNVLTGYYKNPKATSEMFFRSGWLLTGDLGLKDEDGFFFITGRKKELIIKGGENIAPREIDDVLYQHPSVLEACVFAVADDNYGEQIAACILAKDSAQLSADELSKFCQKSLGKFKTPAQIIFTNEPLPKGPSGKILRLQIAKKYANLQTG